MTDQKPKEYFIVTTDIGGEVGPIGSFFEDSETAEQAADMIRRSNNPVVLHLTDHSAYVALKEENVKLRAENERLKPMISERFMVDLVTEWKHFWMNQTQNDEQDYKNYLHRAMGVDANMKYDLANRIVKALRGADEK